MESLSATSKMKKLGYRYSTKIMRHISRAVLLKIPYFLITIFVYFILNPPRPKLAIW